MKVLLALLVIAGTQAISDTEEWQNFKIKHGKFYKSFEEEQNRYLIFKDNLQRIEEQNRKFANALSTFKFGVTPYADLTPEEFLGGFKFLKNIRPASSRVNNYSDDLPDEIDWVQKGAVSEVKNQGMLGCSEVFSTVGTVEGANFLSTGVLVPLSEQNLADCVSPDNFVNCENDWIEKALIYLKETGVTSEADYDGNCNTAEPVVKIRNYTYVNSGDELDLKKSVASNGPVNVIVSASANFQLYVSGILDDESCHPDELNHAMLVVGYGTLDGIDYWIVKNSWGKSWGMEGYIWMRRNKNNQCGIASSALYTAV